MYCVPLMSESPSFASSTTGSIPARDSASPPGRSAPSKRASPSPMSTSARCASGAEIARRADRPLRRDPRHDAAIEHLQETFDHDLARARVTEREDLRAQHDHRAHFVVAEVGTYAAGMAAHQVALQGAHVARRDVHFRERAEAGVDAVDGARIVAALEAIDDRSGAAHRFAALRERARPVARGGRRLRDPTRRMGRPRRRGSCG